MRTNFQQVGDFHKKFGLLTADDNPPLVLDDQTFLFRYQFLLEELSEMLSAHRALDVEKFADAIGDLIYVAYGTAHLAGIPMDAVFAAIQKANMAKERAEGDSDSRSLRKSALDVVKPAGWQPPDVEAVLEAHRRSFV